MPCCAASTRPLDVMTLATDLNLPAPLVSVAIATYNGAPYLRAQLDSIYAQTYQPIEVVVTDDGSTDGTLDILAEYRDRYGLRFFQNEGTLGLVKNFERAIALCRGEFMALCDQDDLWKPEKLAVMVAALGDRTLVYDLGHENLLADGTLITLTHPPAQRRFRERYGTGTPTHRLLASNWVVSHNILFHRELVAAALPFPPHQPFHDAWLAIAATKLRGICFIDRGLTIYRKHPASVTYRLEQAATSQKVAARQRERAAIAAEIQRLESLQTHPLFDDPDRRFMGQLIGHYRDRLGKGWHWRACGFALRYADYFFPYRTWGQKLKFVLKSLLA